MRPLIACYTWLRCSAKAAAFACANGAGSVPVFTAAEVHRIVAKVDDR